jgi:G3E family GTPase
VRLDSIICLIDAENIVNHLTQHTTTAMEQIEFADFCIITKWIDMSPLILDSIETIIRRVNAGAPIIDLPTSDISLDLLLDTDRISFEDAEMMADIEDDHHHVESLGSSVHRSDYLFDSRLLSDFFRELPYETYRVKGFIRLSNDPSKTFIVQKVWARFTVTEMVDPPKEDKNVLVFIGQNINPFLINIELAKCRSQRK